MILEIDMGNTRSKWRVRTGNRTLARGVCLTTAFPDDGILALPKPEQILIASVASEASTGRAMGQLEDLWNLIPVRVTAARQCGLVINAYQDPATMGVDRWLALLAAFRQRQSRDDGVMVVSCGTAVTVDCVDSQGCHEGGYILPGLQMMMQMLLEKTGRIDFEPGAFTLERAPGTTTQQAVQRGAVHGLLSLLERSWADCERRWTCPTEVWFTGGDGRLLCDGLIQSRNGIRACFQEMLVLEGLQSAVEQRDSENM